MQVNDTSLSKVSDVLKRLEDLRKSNTVCIQKSQQIFDKTKKILLRSSKIL